VSETWSPPGADSADRSLLAEVAGWEPGRTLESLDTATLAELTRRRGIDWATALLFQRITASPRHGTFIRQIESLRASPPAGITPGHLLIVPGAYYAEYPHVGGDGQFVREPAATLGFTSAMVPCRSVASLAKSAACVIATLSAQERLVILVSLSKGSADMKLALRDPRAAEAFGHVTAWIDLSGLTEGTPVVDRVLDSALLNLVARALFHFRGHDHTFLRDLSTRPTAPLAGDLRVPSHITTIHIAGFPMTRHLSTRLTRRHHRRLASRGPNDGNMLLAGLLARPGYIYPIWGADHYLRPTWDVGTLVKAVLAWFSKAEARDGTRAPKR
jgi:hypothetical protein